MFFFFCIKNIIIFTTIFQFTIQFNIFPGRRVLANKKSCVHDLTPKELFWIYPIVFSCLPWVIFYTCKMIWQKFKEIVRNVSYTLFFQSFIEVIVTIGLFCKDSCVTDRLHSNLFSYASVACFLCVCRTSRILWVSLWFQQSHYQTMFFWLPSIKMCGRID